MLVPVYESPLQVDSTNIAAFRVRVNELVDRYGAVVVDCSDVTVIGPSGMRVLRIAARDATVTLVNPNPGLQLMAAAYGFEVDRTQSDRHPHHGGPGDGWTWALARVPARQVDR
jgi:anti-anti-sigma regulatory factor